MGVALIVAAHCDDAVLGAGTWVSRWRGKLAVAYLTDGAPRDPRFRPRGEWDKYRRQRQREARRAWRWLYPGARLFFGRTADQELAQNLRAAAAWLRRIADGIRPVVILAPAFEGGHPDHDAANFLAARLARRLGLPAFEYALYGQHNGELTRQSFGAGPGLGVYAAWGAWGRKRQALGLFESQGETLAYLDGGAESLRRLPRHDYGHPAQSAVYEGWQFPIHGRQVAAACAAMIGGGAEPQGERPACAC